jgi:hypothetical protein
MAWTGVDLEIRLNPGRRTWLKTRLRPQLRGHCQKNAGSSDHDSSGWRLTGSMSHSPRRLKAVENKTKPNLQLVLVTPFPIWKSARSAIVGLVDLQLLPLTASFQG